MPVWCLPLCHNATQRQPLANTRLPCIVGFVNFSRVIASVAITFAAFIGTSSPAFASPIAGDDNADGIITEDESGWDCTTMGNGVCGPGNGVQAGQYGNGNLVPWQGPAPTWCLDICLGA